MELLSMLLVAFIIGLFKIRTKLGKIILTLLTIVFAFALFLFISFFAIGNIYGPDLDAVSYYLGIGVIVINIIIWIIPLKKEED
ncbi:hypothetical protein U472_09645 [Orenia metallireducens]|jgi:hypothetical protein|uniref:Uncharacterized protein n=1 Tax=Orenia metallireducens TaxID=1413210 RepID=A0A1C0A7S4_9FIRM|nr:hypothetical protein [Orenia metallireducens]OCL26264.1 hypothetical protein U472_09645 [Orenia metallireducens]